MARLNAIETNVDFVPPSAISRAGYANQYESRQHAIEAERAQKSLTKLNSN